MMFNGRQALKGLGCGCGCGSRASEDGQANYTLNGLRGLGFETSDYIPAGVSDFLSSSSISDSVANATGFNVPVVPNWGVLLAGATVVWFVTQPSGSSYRGERKKLRAKYAGYRQVTRKSGSYLSSI